MATMKTGMAVGILTACVFGFGRSSMDTQARPGTKKSLYQRLGKKPAITAVVDQFVANVANDHRINQRLRPPISLG